MQHVTIYIDNYCKDCSEELKFTTTLGVDGKIKVYTEKCKCLNNELSTQLQESQDLVKGLVAQRTKLEDKLHLQNFRPSQEITDIIKIIAEHEEMSQVLVELKSMKPEADCCEAQESDKCEECTNEKQMTTLIKVATQRAREKRSQIVQLQPDEHMTPDGKIVKKIKGNS